ncbi:hypothetical protein DUI87_08778 [Hirundo rustica rustica]|uniref:Uncharacterized protein n=1 Tax=Hirundo rustica rustica TaxID=333673 RepID=A0A3M0KSI7_HIRRU|nr:hypothetical protein DUI87_08778 [Hirundo rustica rustica]
MPVVLTPMYNKDHGITDVLVEASCLSISEELIELQPVPALKSSITMLISQLSWMPPEEYMDIKQEILVIRIWIIKAKDVTT